jgi:GTP-binding protein HflX
MSRYPHSVPISARAGQGIGKLEQTVASALSRGFKDIDVEMGVDNGRLLAYLAANGEILSRRYRGDRVIVHCRMPETYVGRLRDDEAVVRTHAMGGWTAADGNGSASAPVEDVA